MKKTIINSKYLSRLRENGSTQSGFQVTKGTRHGTFTCSAWVCEEDEPYKNNFFGFHIAEIKCDIESNKVKLRKLYERMLQTKHLLDVAEMSAHEGNSSDTAIIEFLTRQLEVTEKEYNNQKDFVRYFENFLQDYVTTHLKARKDTLDKLSTTNLEN